MIAKCILLGTIGKKETKVIHGGNNLTVLTIATDRQWLDRHNEKQEVTSWHNVNCFNKIGDIVHKHAAVGQLIYIEGEITHKRIKGKDGTERWDYSVSADHIKLLPQGRKRPEENSDESFGNVEQPVNAPLF